MAIEKTLSIIKPDAVRRALSGKINARFEEVGLKIVAQKRLRLTKAQAEGFYAVHSERFMRVYVFRPYSGASVGRRISDNKKS